MARFKGIVGYAIREESPAGSGVWVDSTTEIQYTGDIIENRSRYQTFDKVNNDISITNQFSIVADDFAYSHSHHIRYVVWDGVKWAVESATVSRPRIILSVGGVYNG